MRKRIISAVVVLCLIVGLFAACGKNVGKSAQAEMELKWTEDSFKPPINVSMQDWSTLRFKKTTYQKVDYCFAEDSFEEKRAKNYIKRESKLIAYADKVLGNKRDGVKIYLDEMVEGKKIRTKEAITYDTLWAALNRVHKVNSLEAYGLFYLYSREKNLMESEEQETVADKELALFFSEKENLRFLDFTVPMIDNKIFEQYQVDMIRAAAKSFAAWYVKQYSWQEYEALCGNIEFYDRKKLVADKNAWLKSLGVNERYREKSKVFWKLTDYVWVDDDLGCDPADYEIEQSDAVWIMYSKDIKKTGYWETIRKYNDLEPLRAKDFAEAREFLKDYLPSKVDKVKLVVYLHQIKKTEGIFQRRTNDIQLNQSWDVVTRACLHEYIHYLTVADDRYLNGISQVFCREGTAVWISDLQCEGRLFKKWAQSIVERGEEKELEMNRAYLDYASVLNSVKEGDARDKTRKAPKGIPYAIDLDEMYTYPEYGVILKYIYETYGMEKTMELLKSDADFEKVLGKSLDYIYFEAADFAKKEMKRIEEEQ